MAAGDLVTLLQLEQYLSLAAGNADEPTLSALITAASGFVGDYCGRQFFTATYTETRNGKGGKALPLLQPPVQSVSSLSIDGTGIPAGGLTSAGYYLAGDVLALNGFRFCKGWGNVVIVYSAGFAAIPADLQQACMELVALRYKERKHFDQRSEANVSGQTTTFFVGDLKPSTKTVLEFYRRRISA